MEKNGCNNNQKGNNIRQNSNIYMYTVRSADTTSELSSTLFRHTGQKLSLKICKTNLGILVAEEIYNKQNK